MEKKYYAIKIHEEGGSEYFAGINGRQKTTNKSVTVTGLFTEPADAMQFAGDHVAPTLYQVVEVMVAETGGIIENA